MIQLMNRNKLTNSRLGTKYTRFVVLRCDTNERDKNERAEHIFFFVILLFVSFILICILSEHHHVAVYFVPQMMSAKSTIKNNRLNNHLHATIGHFFRVHFVLILISFKFTLQQFVVHWKSLCKTFQLNEMNLFMEFYQRLLHIFSCILCNVKLSNG